MVSYPEHKNNILTERRRARELLLTSLFSLKIILSFFTYQSEEFTALLLITLRVLVTHAKSPNTSKMQTSGMFASFQRVSQIYGQVWT